MKILTKPCLQCGTTITKPQNESLKNWHGRHKFCSRYCLGKSNSLKGIGQKTRFQLGQKALNPIKVGQHLSLKTQFKKGHKKTPEWYRTMLGRSPWNKGKRHPGVTGSKNYNWKGGITKLNTKIRQSPEMGQWRMDVFKRDNYTCVLCGRKRVKGDRVILNADHYPKLFYVILQKNNITTFEQALACEELWDIKNGRTLCIECHLPTKGVNQYTKSN